MKFVVAFMVSLFLGIAVCIPVRATETRGLELTPARQSVEVSPGSQVLKQLTIANITSDTLDVRLSVERFSVIDHGYDFQFHNDAEKWVTFEGGDSLQIEAGKSKTATVAIAPSASAKVGGHYFTVVASVTRQDGVVMRVAQALYVTVSGTLITTGTLSDEEVPVILYLPIHQLKYGVSNTGNVHFPIYAFSHVDGQKSDAKSTAAHMVLPGTIRDITQTVATPLLPGVYTLEYGYDVESGEGARHARPVLVVPLWFVGVVLGLGVASAGVVARRRRLKVKFQSKG